MKFSHRIEPSTNEDVNLTQPIRAQEALLNAALSGQAGEISRRSFVGGLTATALGLAVVKSCSKGGAQLDQGDLLVDPDKFRQFVDNYKDISETLGNNPEMPLPYEVFLAVGIHESKDGTSELAVKANNMHGIVAKDGWEGAIYEKATEESVTTEAIGKLAAEQGSKLKILHKESDGRIRVKYPRPFRKYAEPEDSFADFQKKIYFINQNGTFRYTDVVDYLKGGGRDPYKVVALMADSDEPGEAKYATGPEWLPRVQAYIKQVQEYTEERSADIEPPKETEAEQLPSNQSKIDMSKIKFDEFGDQPKDKKLIEKMKEAISSLRMEDFKEFKESGIKDKSTFTRDLIGKAKYDSGYNSDSIKVEFLVWHLWAFGVKNGDKGDKDRGPQGASHTIDLERLIRSWANNSGNSAQFLLGDSKRKHELWQLAKNPATTAGHIRSGVQDEGAKGRAVTNHNSIAMEVQSDSIHDVDSEQFKKMILWATDQLIHNELVKEGMTREMTDKIVDHSVIGHGKNGGLEFGYKYTRPLIAALQQYVFIAIQS